MALPAYALGRASFPELYEHILVGPLFRPWVDDLLERANLRSGARVLDLACGTGIVAREARARVAPGGRVAGLDVAAGMLEVARGFAPEVEWREGNAAALPFGSGEFDVVVCQQGFQFFADKPAAAREIRRVLAPGGRAVLATWRPIEEAPCFREAHRAAEPRVGKFTDERFGLTDGDLQAHLRAAGFREVRMERLSRRVTLGDPGTFLRMNAMAIVGLSGAGKGLDDPAREKLVAAIAEDSARTCAQYLAGGQLSFEAATNVAIAA